MQIGSRKHQNKTGPKTLSTHRAPRNLSERSAVTRVRTPNGNRTKVTKEFLRTPVHVSATYRL